MTKEVIAAVETEEGTKKVESTSKKVSLLYSSDLHYKFDDVVLEGQGQLSFKAFNFEVFEGMGESINKIIREYQILEANAMYAQSFKQEQRDKAFLEITLIKHDYLSKAKEQLQELQKPVLTEVAMTDAQQQANMLKRLNNSIVFSNLIAVASIEDLENLFEDNKDNAEIRAQLKAKVTSIMNNASAGVKKDKAIRVKGKINAYEREITNVDYFDDLESLEKNLEYVFSENNRDYYHASLENGFEDMGTTRIFNK